MPNCLHNAYTAFKCIFTNLLEMTCSNILPVCISAFHHSADLETRVAPRSGWVLYSENGPLLWPWCSTRIPGLHELLHCTLRREWLV